MLDFSWSNSRSNLLLSISLDNTVCCWKVNEPENEPYRVFENSDLLTCVFFHPQNEELFVTGSIDKTIKIWNLNEKRCISSHNTQMIVTALCFTQDAKFILAGTYQGFCFCYQLIDDKEIKISEDIKFKNHKITKGGRKISGIELMPDGKNIIISSNDNCVRMYNLKTCELVWKAKNLLIGDFQIHASPSETGKYIICGSQDLNIHFWEMAEHNSPPNHDTKENQIIAYESWLAHGTTVVSTQFAPTGRRKTKWKEGGVLVSACTQGTIKVWEQKRV